MDYYLVLKNDILPFTTTWIDVEDIMLSEICQRKINSIWIQELKCERKNC